VTLDFKITHKDVFPETDSNKPDFYTERVSSRAILKDSEGKIALVTHKHEVRFWQLPGGGLEEGETEEEALSRECKEEAGCNISIIKKIGEGREFRDDLSKVYISHVYLTEVAGEKEEPLGDKKDQQYGMEVRWETPEEALRILTDLRKTLIEKKLMNEYNRRFFNEANIRVLEYTVENKILG